jgi:hypothetical protein
MAEIFSQQFCTLAPSGAGGRLIAGDRMPNCLVQVADGELTFTQAPEALVAKVPAASVEIVTPSTLRKLGTAVIVKFDGRLLAVEFDMVYRRQRQQAKEQQATQEQQAKAGKRTLSTAVASVFTLSDVASLPKSMRLARELSREFTTALVAAGAADRG